ncbi:MAG: hypothetical protein GYB67_01930 [Chloroflexi bacterium]|nr:hypothetical protein [Chloroflexota bacterium]
MGQLIMLVFPSRETVPETVDHVQALDYVKIKHSAVMTKAEDGETVVFEDDVHPNEGSIAGGTLGALMGSLGIAQLGAFLLPGVGPIIALGAGALIGGLVGGATGGLTAGLLDLGFKEEELQQLSAQLETGRLAVIMEVDGEADTVARLRGDLAQFEIEVITEAN